MRIPTLPRALTCLGLVVGLLLAGCGGDDAATTEASQFPTGSVRTWFDLLDAGDAAAALELTHGESMLLVLAAENDVEPGELASLLRRGATAESAAEYLADFSDSMRARYGGSLATLSVDSFNSLGETFAAVVVTGEGAATIITRRAPGGLWQVDLVGTVGPALVAQLRGLLEDAVADEENRETLLESFRNTVIPALEAAAAADPENLDLASEIRAMRSLLGT